MRNFNKPCGCKRECMCAYPEASPAQQLPAQTAPTKYSPTRQNSEFVGKDVYIPVVHPTHTTQTNHTTYKYMHSYPHTRSVVNSTSEEHHCVCPPREQCTRRPRRRW